MYACDVLGFVKKGHFLSFLTRAYSRQSPHLGIRPASPKRFSPWHPRLLDLGPASHRGGGLCPNMGRCQLHSLLQSEPAFPELHNEKPHLFPGLNVYSLFSSIQGLGLSCLHFTNLFPAAWFRWHSHLWPPQPSLLPEIGWDPPCRLRSADERAPISCLLSPD